MHNVVYNNRHWNIHCTCELTMTVKRWCQLTPAKLKYAVIITMLTCVISLHYSHITNCCNRSTYSSAPNPLFTTALFTNKNGVITVSMHVIGQRRMCRSISLVNIHSGRLVHQWPRPMCMWYTTVKSVGNLNPPNERQHQQNLFS